MRSALFQVAPRKALRAGLLGVLLVSSSAYHLACSSGDAGARETSRPQPPAAGVSAGQQAAPGGAGSSGMPQPTAPASGAPAVAAADGGAGGRAGAAGARAGAGGKAAAGGGAGKPATSVVPGAFKLPPANGGLDYQLGGAYTPADAVKIVSRDRTEKPAAGLYNICYVNGFQAQQAENDMWLTQHPDLVLRDQAGKPVIDKDWNEMLFDTSTAAKREALGQVVSGWIAGCATAGFDAVEIDNLDSYSRSGGRLKEADAVAFVRILADAAHSHGLAIAQKNASELVSRRTEMGTDFVVAEECNRYDECDDYRAGYDDHVLVIEYRRSDFQAGCAKYPQLSIVLRDVELVKSGQSGYVYEGC